MERVTLLPGENEVRQSLSYAHLNVEQSGVDGPTVTIVSTVLPPPESMNPRAYASATTLAIHMDRAAAVRMAAEILTLADQKGWPLPVGISLAK